MMERFGTLEEVPTDILRSADITSAEEEAVVQSEWDKRLMESPPIDVTPVRSYTTDRLTPEKEREIQLEIDARREEKRQRYAEEPVDEPETPPGPEPEPQPEPEMRKKFCEFCDAKGPISHKKNCSRPR